MTTLTQLHELDIQDDNDTIATAAISFFSTVICL